MKRMLLTAATTTVMALAAPALASAAHHSNSACHRRAHHACAHVRHAHRAKLLTFGTPVPSTGSGTSSTSGSGSTPPAPSVPTSSGDSSGETAGTVTSFTGGVLTITLNDGTTVSGKVTEETEIHCSPAVPTEGSEGDDHEGGEAGGDDGEDSHGGESGASVHGADMSSGGSDDGGEGDHGSSSACTTEDLLPGTVVREAELSVGGSGAVWDHVDLIK
jgi:hypothetical protein